MHKTLLYALLALDVVWWILWIAFLHWFMLGSDGVANMIYIREAFWKTSSHFFLAIALVTTLKDMGDGYVSIASVPWLLFGIFIDLYTVYDVFHVIGEHTVDFPRLQALQALSIVAVIFSGLGLGLYLYIVGTRRSKHRRLEKPSTDYW